MGSWISKLFVDLSVIPDDGYGMIQILFLGVIYGYILCYASQLIQNGSELWLLIPKLAHTVGAIVLPVLGAVPEGAIVIFSGTGPDAQHKVSVGIGALAGSTTMLLTIPWCMTVIGGRVDLDDDGSAEYLTPRSALTPRSPLRTPWSRQKLTPGNFMKSGIVVNASIKYLGKIMLLTLIPFVIVQIPAIAGNCVEKKEAAHKCKSYRYAALAGAIVATVMFILYVWDQARTEETDPIQEGKVDMAREDLIAHHLIDIEAIEAPHSPKHVHVKSFQEYLTYFLKKIQQQSVPGGAVEKAELATLLRGFSDKLAGTTTTNPQPEQVIDSSSLIRSDSAGESDIRQRERRQSSGEFGTFSASNINASLAETRDDESDPDDTQMPEDLAHLTPEQQQVRLMWRSTWMMSLGTMLVIIFTDPIVSLFNELGKRTGIKPFYIAFCLAPLASNASQIIPAYLYALKKTEKTATIALASLVGGAAVNNTFCLAVFLFLVFAEHLKWEFAAETIAVLVIQIVMVVFCFKRTHRAYTAFIVLAFFPATLLLVFLLERFAGMD